MLYIFPNFNDGPLTPIDGASGQKIKFNNFKILSYSHPEVLVPTQISVKRITYFLKFLEN